ncbi:MAG: T9SS type A sorting domain-containing protein [Armatimonadetes bacterium]|nr:T9SS type A sorting domain-containing protein [Armatimonadota bacterium]
MRKLKVIAIILCLFFISGIFAQDTGDIIWSNSYGEIDKEYCYSVNLTTDGGYIMGGYSNSFGAGDNDVYLVKTDAGGDVLWTRTYGGIDTDKCKSVQQCSDGGYIIAGETNSFGAGNYDVYLIKVDTIGDTLWTRTFGGTGIDRAESVKETTDGGYIVAGNTGSFGAGGKDVYLIKTDVNGDMLWTKTFGAIDDEEGHSVILTIDEGYVIAGITESFGAGGRDVYLIKTNANGDTLWTSTHGGINDDRGYAVQQCNDGGYIIAGDTKSSGAGLSDFFLVKTDSNGGTSWTTAYGGSSIDIGYSLQQDSDGGYIIAGSTQSFNVGYFDIYLVKTDAIGDTLWTRTYGSFDYEHGRSVQLTTDGNYVVAGWTFSYGPGITAFWLLKIAGEGTSFYPPENLYVDESIGLATWEPPLARDLLGYNIYLDGVFIDFTTDLFWQYDDLAVGTTYLAGVSALYDDPGESVIIEYEFTYIPVFDPPENFYVDESTGLASWESPLVRDLLGYNVYLNGAFINFTTNLFWQYTDLVAGTTYLAGVSATYDDGVSVIIEYEFTYNPATFDPPDNVQIDPDLGLLTWEAPGGGQLFELTQHDGNPLDGYFQSFDHGYGVIYDLSGYTDVTLEMLDFRHSSWGTMGIWEYALHIVDWDTQTEVAVVTDLQTTGDDIWEEGISLCSVSESSLVGVFMEPMGYMATDAYPCLDGDGVGPDGLSFYGPLANYPSMSLSSIGDFLMDLWIMAEEVDGVVKAKRFEANFGSAASRVGTAIPDMDFITLNQTSNLRDLIGYNVYLDSNLEDTVGIDVFEYQYTGLINGQSYVAGVSAEYDAGESEIIEVEFTFLETPVLPPENVVITVVDFNDVHLEWEPPNLPDETRLLLGYKVYRDGDEIAYLDDPNLLTYDDLALDGGTYEYWVTAVYDEGESDPSNIEEVIIILYSPQNLTAIVQGINNVFLSWDAPATRAFDYYNIYRDGSQIVTNINSTFYLDEGLAAGNYVYNVAAVYDGGWESELSNDAQVTLDAGNSPIPKITELSGNYPNPFNPETIIDFSLKEAEIVRIDIYNSKGQQIRTLVNGYLEPDFYNMIWNGNDEIGKPVSSGIYFYKMDAGKYSSIRKMILLK